MPSFGVVAAAATADVAGSPAILRALDSDGALEYARVNYIEHGVGVKPGMASVTISNVVARDEAAGNYVMNDGSVISDKKLQKWSRWAIRWRGVDIFCGALIGRRDDISDQCVHLTFLDDRILLSKIALTGCLVYDRVAQAVKFVDGYRPHVNPGGRRNCTPVTISLGSGDMPGVCYVFSELAEQATLGLSAYNRIGDEGQVRAGDAVFWTVERWLNHLRVFSLAAWEIASTATDKTVARLNTNKLEWPYFGFSDSASLITHKMPDIDFTGKTVWAALIKGLEQTGEFGANIQYKTRTGALYFVPLTLENNFDQNNVSTLDLLKSGVVNDMRTIYAGTIDDDASELATRSVVRGQRVKVESQFGYIDASDTVFALEAAVSPISTLYPAWTAEEEFYFLQIIWKGLDRQGNRLKDSQGDDLALGSEWLLSRARQDYPKVFRAFEIRSDNISSIMAGHGESAGKYADFDYIKGHRSMLDEQLQPFFEKDTAGKVARGRLRLPVRIQVSSGAASDSSSFYLEVPFNNGVRFGDDGLLYFDGLTDDISDVYNVYTGHLREGQADNNPSDRTAGSYPRLRNILINMAVELDTRCSAEVSLRSYDPNNSLETVHPSVIPTGTSGTDVLQDYMFNPEGFREEHQVNSRPCTANAFQVANADGTAQTALTLPLNKILHDDDAELLRAAKRRLRRTSKISRRFEFRLPGIRPDLYAGMFITDVVLRPDGGKYKLNAPLQRVRYDFDKQHTIVAGQDIIAELLGE